MLGQLFPLPIPAYLHIPTYRWQYEWNGTGITLGTSPSPAKSGPEPTPISSITVNIDHRPDIPYFQFGCHLISKNSSFTPLILRSSSIRVDVACLENYKRNHLLVIKQIEIKPHFSFLGGYHARIIYPSRLHKTFNSKSQEVTHINRLLK